MDVVCKIIRTTLNSVAINPAEWTSENSEARSTGERIQKNKRCHAQREISQKTVTDLRQRKNVTPIGHIKGQSTSKQAMQLIASGPRGGIQVDGRG